MMIVKWERYWLSCPQSVSDSLKPHSDWPKPLKMEFFWHMYMLVKVREDLKALLRFQTASLNRIFLFQRLNAIPETWYSDKYSWSYHSGGQCWGDQKFRAILFCGEFRLAWDAWNHFKKMTASLYPRLSACWLKSKSGNLLWLFPKDSAEISLYLTSLWKDCAPVTELAPDLVQM